MDCYSFDKIISDYIDANLNVKQRQEADEHISECPNCREKLYDLKGILGELRCLPSVKTRPDFDSRLMERIEKNKEHSESPFIRAFRDYSRPISVVAAVMLLVATSIFVYTSVVIPNSEGKAMPTAQIRSIQQDKSLSAPAAATAARPVMASSNSESELPDTNKIEAPNYNKQIMMVNENK